MIAVKLLGGFKLVCDRLTLALGFALVHQTKHLQTTKQNKQNTNKKQRGQLVLKGGDNNARITHETNRHYSNEMSQENM